MGAVTLSLSEDTRFSSTGRRGGADCVEGLFAAISRRWACLLPTLVEYTPQNATGSMGGPSPSELVGITNIINHNKTKRW